MTREHARSEAVKTAAEYKTKIAVVREGLHADEFAIRDSDGESYGYCPLPALSILYKYGEVVETVG